MVSPTATNGRTGAGSRARREVWTWLALLVGAYFVVSFGLSYLRLLEFQTTNWDLGIFQQSLWSTSHGRVFFEAGDYEFFGTVSFLQVHPAFVLYAIVPVYAAFPSPVVLFVVQSGVVALSAVPLFAIARRLLGADRPALYTCAIYLAWTPILSSNLYDFHLESFLPLELFVLFWFWMNGRYGPAFGVAGLAFVTLEVAPFLVFAVGLFWLLPPIRPTVRRAWTSRRRNRDHPRPPLSARFRSWFEKAWRDPAKRAAMLLMIASASAYVVLRFIEYYALNVLIGIPPSHLALGPLGYVAGTTSTSLPLGTALTSRFATKVELWLIIYALLGFVPWMAPRTVVLAAPWLLFTFLSPVTVWMIFGAQYGFINAFPLMVGFVYGWKAVRDGELRRLALALARSGNWLLARIRSALRTPAAPRVPIGFTSWRVPPRRIRNALRAAGIALVSVNLFLSPLNPWYQGRPMSAPGYQVSYLVPAGFQSVNQLLQLIPSGAIVLASDDLFPLVANDVHSYPLNWTATALAHLPFSPSSLPTYVLLSRQQLYAVPPWLAPLLYHAGTYGMRGIAWSTPTGPVVLFQESYRGSFEVLGAPATVPTFYYGRLLTIGPSGHVLDNPMARFGVVIASAPRIPLPIWYGPYVSLPPGTYSITIVLNASSENVTNPLSLRAPIAYVNGTGFGQPDWFHLVITPGNLNATGWSTFSYTVSLPLPVLNVEVRGYLANPSDTVLLDYIAIAAK